MQCALIIFDEKYVSRKTASLSSSLATNITFAWLFSHERNHVHNGRWYSELLQAHATPVWLFAIVKTANLRKLLATYLTCTRNSSASVSTCFETD